MGKGDLCGGSERAGEDGLHIKKKQNGFLFFTLAELMWVTVSTDLI